MRMEEERERREESIHSFNTTAPGSVIIFGNSSNDVAQTCLPFKKWANSLPQVIYLQLEKLFKAPLENHCFGINHSTLIFYLNILFRCCWIVNYSLGYPLPPISTFVLLNSMGSRYSRALITKVSVGQGIPDTFLGTLC